ncbi:MAG: GFA family protein [Halioglobus sp.]|nr:GFA family protein [Halioglobus sp.]
MEIPATGSCQCGAVTYTLGAEPFFTYACHCHTCQKRTGSACAVALVVAVDALDIAGELATWSRVSDKGDTNTRYSCASCGNVIHGIGDSSPELTKLQSGTLDNTDRVAPEVHMWTRSAQPWITFAPGVPRFDTQPDDPLELLQAALDYRAARAAGG